MGVGVDEAGRDAHSSGVDHDGGGGIRHRSDVNHAIAHDTDVGDARNGAAAIDEQSTANENVEVHRAWGTNFILYSRDAQG